MMNTLKNLVLAVSLLSLPSLSQAQSVSPAWWYFWVIVMAQNHQPSLQSRYDQYLKERQERDQFWTNFDNEMNHTFGRDFPSAGGSCSDRRVYFFPELPVDGSINMSSVSGTYSESCPREDRSVTLTDLNKENLCFAKISESLAKNYYGDQTIADKLKEIRQDNQFESISVSLGVDVETGRKARSQGVCGFESIGMIYDIHLKNVLGKAGGFGRAWLDINKPVTETALLTMVQSAYKDAKSDAANNTRVAIENENQQQDAAVDVANSKMYKNKSPVNFFSIRYSPEQDRYEGKDNQIFWSIQTQNDQKELAFLRAGNQCLKAVTDQIYSGLTSPEFQGDLSKHGLQYKDVSYYLGITRNEERRSRRSEENKICGMDNIFFMVDINENAPGRLGRGIYRGNFNDISPVMLNGMLQEALTQ